MASLAEQLQQALNSHRPVVPDVIEFRCGKMKMDANGTTVQPDVRKGRITVKTAEADGCLHFTWTERNSNMAEAEDDLILFPGDAAFVRVEAARNNSKNNRVFALKFAATKKVHFFWMQEPDKEKDDELIRKINIKINGDEPAAAPAATNVHQMDQASLLALFEQGRQQPGAANPDSNTSPSQIAATQGNQETTAGSATTDAATTETRSEPAGEGGQAASGTEQMDVDSPPGSDKPPASSQ